MTASSELTCSRLWEVEALEDGRLGDVDRHSFERHVRSCEECSHECASLKALRETLQNVSAAAVATTTPIEHHRLRQSILRNANAVLLSSSSNTPLAQLSLRPFFLVGALVVGLAFVISVLLRSGGGPKDGGMVATTDHQEPSTAARTSSTAAEPSRSSITPSGEAVSPTQTKMAHSTAMSHAPKAAWPSLSAELFDDGVASFKSGAFGRADEQLERFVEAFPNDPRCEDADYLRVVAHRRAGDSAGAKELARIYLLKYPNGLRRIDTQRIIDSN